MILDADKKEEEAARERPEQYIRAIRGEVSGSRGRNVSSGGVTPTDVNAPNDLAQRSHDVSRGGLSDDSTGEEESRLDTPTSESGIARAQDAEEADRQRRHQQRRRGRRWPWSGAAGSTGEADERTLLLPPTYQEATIGLEKRRRRRIWMYCWIGVVVILMIVFVTEQVDEYLYKRRVRSAGWLRGGRDGMGKYDDDWAAHFPRLDSEVFLRQCDLFSAPEEMPAWSTPSTSDKIWTSHASYTIPRTAAQIILNARGSKMSGEVMVVTGEPGRRPVYSTGWDPDGDDILITVAASFTDVAAVDFHSCLFGKDGVYGVSLVGRPDAGPPVTSSWLEGFFEFGVYISLPRAKPLGNGNATGLELGQLKIRTERMGFAMWGDVVAESVFFEEVHVTTSEALISAGSIQSRGMLSLSTSGSPIYARNLTSTDGDIVLWTHDSNLNCGSCVAKGYILLALEKGSGSGTYRAGIGLDVTSTSGHIEGNFHAPRLWMTNNEGDIRGKFSGIEYAQGKEQGGLLVQTMSGDIDIELACAPGGKKGPGFDGTKDPAEGALKLGVAARHGRVRVNFTELPTHVPTHLELAASEGHIQALLPERWQGDISMRPPRGKTASVNWPNGGYSGHTRRKLMTEQQGIRDWSSGDITWSGAVAGNVTVIPTYAEKDKKAGPWNLVAMSSNNGNVRLEF